MSSGENEQVLIDLKRKRDALETKYHRELADIRHRKEQYDAKMNELAELGCLSLEDAEQLELSLQEKCDAKIEEIKALL